MATDRDDPPRDPDIADDPRAIRRAYLHRESEARSIGQLCYLVAFFCALGTIEFLLLAIGTLPTPPDWDHLADPDLIRKGFWGLGIFLLFVAIAHIVLGYGLMRLRAWARWTVVALTLLSLASAVGTGLAACLAYPICGTLGLIVVIAIHVLILLPLLAPSSGVVFSRGYREVIRATPDIRCRMHVLLKWFIASILAGVFGLGAFLLAIYFRLIDW